MLPWLDISQPPIRVVNPARCNSYDVEGNQVLEDFEVEEIMGSRYNAEGNKVLYLIKWKGYPEESEWTEEPLEHLPRAPVRAFHASHPGAAMDARLRRRARGA